MTAPTEEVRHTTRYSTEPTDGGYIWRCDGCGWVGYGLLTAEAAAREAERHVKERDQ